MNSLSLLTPSEFTSLNVKLIPLAQGYQTRLSMHAGSLRQGEGISLLLGNYSGEGS